MRSTLLKSFLRLNHSLGRDPLIVQAAGGNISVKDQADSMLIKTTGFRLKDVRASRGWLSAPWRSLRRRLPDLKQFRGAVRREACYAEVLARASPGPSKRISMEAGFHAVLPQTWVAHTHSVAGMLLGMLPASTARALAVGAIGSAEDIGWIPPSLPGYSLTMAMTNLLDRRKKPPCLWVQRNHGLAWTGKTAEGLGKRSQQLESAIRRSFGFQRFPFPHPAGSANCRSASSGPPATGEHGRYCTEICFCRWPFRRFDFRPLFPDFVIYYDLQHGTRKDLHRLSDDIVHLCASSVANQKDKEEVLFAHALLHTLAAQHHCLQPLPRTMIQTLKSLETEKHRLRRVNQP